MKILIISSKNDKKSISEMAMCDALEIAFKLKNIEYSFDQADLNIDCIVVLNRQLLAKARKIKKANKIPIVYFFYKSTAIENCVIDTTNIDFTFIVNDIILKVLYPYPYSSKDIGMMFNIDKMQSNNEYENLDIYISTGERMIKDSALLKILRTINRFTRSKIEINSLNKSLLGIMNSNVTVLDSNNDMERRVANSNLVIGSGYAILYAIKYHKPFIVVGEKGYGGILDKNNFELQYNSFFQGRLGGKFDDAIPEKLLLEDINNVVSTGTDSLLFGDMLISQSRQNSDYVIAKITEIVEYNNQITTDFGNARVIFNPDFTIIKGNGDYWLLGRFTREVISCMNYEYYSVVEKCIEHPILIKEFGASPQIKKRLKELLKNKVIIPVFEKEENPRN